MDEQFKWLWWAVAFYFLVLHQCLIFIFMDFCLLKVLSQSVHVLFSATYAWESTYGDVIFKLFLFPTIVIHV